MAPKNGPEHLHISVKNQHICLQQHRPAEILKNCRKHCAKVLRSPLIRLVNCGDLKESKTILRMRPTA